MHPDRATLESLATALEDLTRRITEVADRHRDGDDDALASELYEIERALQSGIRRLGNLVREL